MKFITTKRNKIIIGFLFIVTSLYLGFGFWISFNPIKWGSPYQTWAKDSGARLLVLVEELSKETNDTKKTNKIKEIDNQLEKINTLVIKRYKTNEKIKNVKNLYEKLKNTEGIKKNITIGDAKKLKDEIDKLFS